MGTEPGMQDVSDTLRVGLVSPVESLDPAHAHFFVDQLVCSQIYEAPFALPKKSGMPAEPQIFDEPLRAEGNRDGMRFSGSVRKGILFSDGTTLTPQHVIDSLRRAAPLMEQAEVSLDGERIAFQLKRPNARFDLVLSQAFLGIVLPQGDKLLGTGPYMMATDSSPRALRLVRNPHSRTQVKIGQILFKCHDVDSDGRPTALLEALEKEEVDFTNILPQEDVRDLKRVRKYIERGNSVALLYLNTERPALKDKRVRKAIGMSIDRLELTEISYKTPMAYAARNILPLSMSTWRDGISYDLEKAKGLLKEAGGIPDRLVMRVIFSARPYLPHPMPTAEYVAQQLEKLGIKTVIEQTKSGDDFLGQAKRGDYDLFLSGWVAESDDPAEFFESQLSERTIPTPEIEISNHSNLCRWRHAGVEEALQRLRREPGEENQKAVLGIVADEVPIVPLMTGSMVFVHSYRVGGFEPTPWGIPDFSDLELRG